MLLRELPHQLPRPVSDYVATAAPSPFLSRFQTQKQVPAFSRRKVQKAVSDLRYINSFCYGLAQRNGDPLSCEQRLLHCTDEIQFYAAGCNGMLPLSATLCCHWQHSQCTIILPPGAVQSCHLIRSRSRLPNPAVRGGMATPVGANRQ